MKVLSKPTAYDVITHKIVEAVERRAGRFQMPWHASHWMALPINVATEAYYRGVNVLSLWLDAQAKKFPTSHWASYRQWLSLGAQVRRGERGSVVVFYKAIEADGDREEPARFVLRTFRVFNAAQVEGWTAPEAAPLPRFEIDEQVDAFVAAVGARVRHGFATARYRSDLDDIEMPSPAWFRDTETSSASQSYHAILLHELVHWSGASHRIGREFGKRFGDETYAFEELIAELGAAFLCGAFGIANEPRPDHAAYVQSWLKVLNRDRKAIFAAAAKAQEAVEYLSQLARENH
ncbi:MAG TPA: zincin-like metallopeptidase domain-containing protein [Rhizomicrobium sp.]|jgi:antirestriction protein ArdC|nr:zincin-like metallopeptidase domain-containing protein [Rhizomicrobium sp.]